MTAMSTTTDATAACRSRVDDGGYGAQGGGPVVVRGRGAEPGDSRASRGGLTIPVLPIPAPPSAASRRRAREPWMAVTGILPGAQVHREAVSCEKIVVKKGLAVNLVHHDAPNPPPSPHSPRKLAAIVLVS